MEGLGEGERPCWEGTGRPLVGVRAQEGAGDFSPWGLSFLIDNIWSLDKITSLIHSLIHSADIS